MPRMTGNRFFAEAVHAYGITHVFFVPTIMLPAMAEMEDRGIRRVVTHGEKAAAYMADGYARASHRPGICLAQTIGSANLAAGLRDAYMACSPVIALTGGVDAASRYKHVDQEIEDFPMWSRSRRRTSTWTRRSASRTCCGRHSAPRPARPRARYISRCRARTRRSWSARPT